MFIRDSRRSYRTYAYTEVPLSTTKLILILRSLHLFGGTRRYYRDMTERILVWRNLFLYGKVLVSTTKLILVLRILYLYYEAYPGLTKLIHVLLNLFLYFRSYTCITELIHVFRSYTCLTEHIHVFQILYLSYGAYTYLTELVLGLQIREYP